MERDLPAPVIIHSTKAYYIIDSADPDLPELIDDACYYVDRYGPDACAASLKRAAKALLKKLAEIQPNKPPR